MKHSEGATMALTAQIANNSANQPDSAHEPHAKVRAGHAKVREDNAKTGPASARFFGFVRESVDGIGNAGFYWKHNSMQKLHRAPLALIVVMAAALISLSSPVLRGQSAAASAEADAPPLLGTFYSLQHPEWPPLPANLFDLPFYSLSNSVFVVDDSSVDYNALEKEAAEKAEAEGMTGGKGGAFGPMAAMYGSNELWIELTQVTNDLTYLTLHNTDTNLSQQLLSKIALPDPYWTPGEITNSATNEIIFSPVPMAGQPIKFFRGAQGYPVVSILPFVTAIEPDTTNFDPGRNGVFVVSLSDTVSSNVTVVYRISGTAINGVDYTNLTGTLTVLAGITFTNIAIQPIEDNLIEFDEPVTLALVVTNGYW